MASLTKIMQISKSVNNVAKLISNMSLSVNTNLVSNTQCFRRLPLQSSVFLHTSSTKYGLMEFFDDEKNWGKDTVKVGREWRLDELRLKSNEDLHKLWFVLIKERNMLLTMQEACKRAYEIFPNPERIDKVDMSMGNLETVVRERNKAYHLLETGETGERPGKFVYSPLGLRSYYRMCEYLIPKFMNKKWHKTHQFGYGGYAVKRFLRFYREKLWNIKRRARNREFNQAMVLLRRFPNLDIEALKEKYPSVDIEKAKRRRKAQGHFTPME
ncbi:PREDICTED: 39S ribosomal protein L47, mitochondrial [Polistes dominula]|uniref:Large ribosomal subunit protein uL29m n=1 Tax=Polistes dominula TaxID=743375 RepID=A0ABM1IRR7_POLDO|nr:PREDICTED: 39S ribosomal protein L47, mitochondrial [Polistes dominula]